MLHLEFVPIHTYLLLSIDIKSNTTPSWATETLHDFKLWSNQVHLNLKLSTRQQFPIKGGVLGFTDGRMNHLGKLYRDLWSNWGKAGFSTWNVLQFRKLLHYKEDKLQESETCLQIKHIVAFRQIYKSDYRYWKIKTKNNSRIMNKPTALNLGFWAFWLERFAVAVY